MKTGLSVIAILAVVLVISEESFAAKQPLCTYKNSEGETIFLTYMPLLKKGEEYIDYSGGDNKCMKKATCLADFTTKVEDCGTVKPTCANKRQYQGVFPLCCIKC